MNLEAKLWNMVPQNYSPNMVWYCRNSHQTQYSSKFFLKDLSIYGKETDPNLALLVQLWPLFSSWRWPKSKIISSSAEKRQPLCYPNMTKWCPYLLSPFRENTITFCNIWNIFTRKKGGITSQTEIWQILFHPHDSWSTSCEKKFRSNIFQFCGYRSQRTFQKNFNPDFQIWLVFLVPFLHVFKIYVT